MTERSTISNRKETITGQQQSSAFPTPGSQIDAVSSTFYDSNAVVTVDLSKVVKQGILMKKGRFYGSQKRYFYLEDFYLKYGDKEGKARKCIDLSQGGGEQEVTLSDNSKKIRVLKLHCIDPETQKFTVLRLKAENKVERDEWVSFLKKAIEPFTKKTTQKSIPEENKTPASNSSSQLKHLINKQKSITLNQISEQILKNRENLNSKITAQDKAFNAFKNELQKLHVEPTLPGPLKERVGKIIDLSSSWQTEQSGTFEFIQLTTKNLQKVVENIALKEIEKNPIDFIRRESF